MARFALLIQETPAIEDGNYLRFSRELAASGHLVELLFVDSLRMLAGSIHADGFEWQRSLVIDAAFPQRSIREVNQDYVWLLGLGERTNFLDKYQLLYALPPQCQFINSLDAIMHLKSKYYLASQGDEFPNPETHASTSAEELIHIATKKRGKWVVKPPAGSLGRNVYLMDALDQDLPRVIRQLCGPANTQYTLLQRYVPEIEQGEKRVLLAGGTVIGQYRRLQMNNLPTNVSQGARTEVCQLTINEQTYCTRLAKQMLQKGALFAGIDLAYPWLIEVNVINPGGVTTIDQLTGTDLAPAVIRAILSSLEKARVS